MSAGSCSAPAVANDIAEVTSLVSSVVIESDNNIVLDFSSKTPDDDEENIMPGTSRSDSSSTSLLSKVIKVISSRTMFLDVIYIDIFRNARHQL